MKHKWSELPEIPLEGKDSAIFYKPISGKWLQCNGCRLIIFVRESDTADSVLTKLMSQYDYVNTSLSSKTPVFIDCNLQIIYHLSLM